MRSIMSMPAARTGKSPRSYFELPLHSSRTPALNQRLHFLHAEPVEIPRNAVLQATRRHRKLQRLLMRRHGLQSVDQTAREAIASTNAIYDMGDLIMPAAQKLLAIVQTC